MDLQDIRFAVERMRHNTLNNYIVAGLTSSLVGDGDRKGKVRLFEASRKTRDTITPHSHRFDFTCLVLKGIVHNTLYVEGITGAPGEEWCRSSIGQVCGADGIECYTHVRLDQPTRYLRRSATYGIGDTYSMTFDEIHSIEFEKGTQVLFFEGPNIVDKSYMLEPWVNGKVVPTFRTEDWMFEKAASTLTK